jgi:pimeloyl-ACP methyl ester carboxylesterase
MGDSDHHDSFDLEEVSNDVGRFIDENKLSIVTVGGHGYGAKIASAFGSYFMERTSGVICFEGGPFDHSYHEAWEEIKNAIVQLGKIDMSTATQGDVFKKIDQVIDVVI